MTRDELIELAKEVGMCGMLTDVVTTIDELERFAALVAADALELADKRIAELEIIVSGQQMLGYLPKGMVAGTVCGLTPDELIKRIRFADDSERKLDVAREACKDIRRAIERECYAAAYIIVSEALAQIGDEDAR